MLDFEFFNPTRIVFGKDRLPELHRLVPEKIKILILYGGGSAKKYGTLDKVTRALPGREIFEFGGIEPNPKYTTLVSALEIIRREKIGFLLAVGGGSVIDGTKFVSLASHYEGNPEDLLTHGFDPVPVRQALPIGTVVTLSGTGSEMNSTCVISRSDSKYVLFSHLAFPRFSILDPTLTFTLPANQVANGVIDAFVHALEQYMTCPAEARLQDRMAEGILRTLVEVGKKTIDHPTDYDARANLVWCAANALNGLIGAGVPHDWTSHMIGQELTTLFGIDHAKTLAVLLPSVWTLLKEQKKDKLLQYASRVWDITRGDDARRVELAIEKTRLFFEELGVPTRLGAYGVRREQIDDIVKVLALRGLTALSETGAVTLDVSRKILEDAFGDGP